MTRYKAGARSPAVRWAVALDIPMTRHDPIFETIDSCNRKTFSAKDSDTELLGLGIRHLGSEIDRLYKDKHNMFLSAARFVIEQELERRKKEGEA